MRRVWRFLVSPMATTVALLLGSQLMAICTFAEDDKTFVTIQTPSEFASLRLAGLTKTAKAKPICFSKCDSEFNRLLEDELRQNVEGMPIVKEKGTTFFFVYSGQIDSGDVLFQDVREFTEDVHNRATKIVRVKFDLISNRKLLCREATYFLTTEQDLIGVIIMFNRIQSPVGTEDHQLKKLRTSIADCMELSLQPIR